MSIYLKNKKLIEEYPFLMPRVYGTDDVPDGYAYLFTILDEMEEGWRLAFADEYLEELKELLVKGVCLETYRVDLIKEKYGSLRWYDHGYSDEIADELHKLHDKYETLSAFTCIDCGKPATRVTKEYICSYCDECVTKLGYTKNTLPSPKAVYKSWLEKADMEEFKALYKKIFDIDFKEGETL